MNKRTKISLLLLSSIGTCLLSSCSGENLDDGSGPDGIVSEGEGSGAAAGGAMFGTGGATAIGAGGSATGGSSLSTGGAASGGSEAGAGGGLAASGGSDDGAGGSSMSTGGSDAGAGGSQDGSGGSDDGAGGSNDGAGGSADGAGGDAAAGDTWTNFGQEFFSAYCFSCHNDDDSGDSSRDYHTLDVVKSELMAIACGVAKSDDDRAAIDCTDSNPKANQFPPGSGPKPSDDERDQLVEWISAGAPE